MESAIAGILNGALILLRSFSNEKRSNLVNLFRLAASEGRDIGGDEVAEIIDEAEAASDRLGAAIENAETEENPEEINDPALTPEVGAGNPQV